jgi:hypothetical protein
MSGFHSETFTAQGLEPLPLNKLYVAKHSLDSELVFSRI